MNNILVVEDVGEKFEDISASLLTVMKSKYCVTRVENLNDAEDAVMNGGWSLILLDISMDISASGAFDYSSGHATMGGIDILERMHLMQISIPTILVTGFDSFQDPDRFDNAIMNLEDVYQLAYDWLGDSYLGCVRYGPIGWQADLLKFLEAWNR